MKPGDLGEDDSHEIDVAIGLAFRQALVAQESNPRRRLELLKEAVLERSHSISSWAANQLCDTGEVASLPEIEKSIRRRIHGERGESEIRFCQARMNIIMSSDRLHALEATLMITSNEVDVRLVRWSVEQLMALQSPQADGILAKFAKAIADLADGSTGRNSLAPIRGTIESHLAANRVRLRQTH